MLKDQLSYMLVTYKVMLEILRQVFVGISDEWFDNKHVVKCFFCVICGSYYRY